MHCLAQMKKKNELKTYHHDYMTNHRNVDYRYKTNTTTSCFTIRLRDETYSFTLLLD